MKNLYKERRWCLWKYVTDAQTGRETKVPFSATSVVNGNPHFISSKPNRGWAVYSVAEKGAQPPYGVGVFLGKAVDSKASHVLCGIDIDGVDHEVVASFASRVVSSLRSYAETSPSGKGLKIFFLMDEKDCKSLSMEQRFTKPASVGGHVEMTFHRGHRFFTVTGETYEGFDTLRLVEKEKVEEFFKLQEEFLETAKLVVTPDNDQGKRRYAGIDRSAVVLKFIAEALRRDPGLDVREVFEELESELGNSDDPERSACHDWVCEQLVAGPTGTRQLERAFKQVDENRDAWGIYDEEINPPFEPLPEEPGLAAQQSQSESSQNETHVPEWVTRLNRTCAVLGNGEGVLIWNRDQYTVITKNWNLKVATKAWGTIFDAETRREVPIIDAWLEHPAHRKVRKLVFDPTQEMGWVGKDFNVRPPMPVKDFSSLSVEELRKGCSKILEVITDSLTSTPEEADWLLKYLAHLVQKPLERPSVHPILFGGYGTGKDTLLNWLKAMFYDGGVVKKHSFQRGGFNPEDERALVVHVVEAAELVRKDVIAAMRDYLTAEHIDINKKFMPPMTVGCYSRVFFSTNHLDGIRIDVNDRRYVPIQSSSRYEYDDGGDVSAFWRDVYAQYEDDGPDFFYWWLKKLELGDFNPNAKPVALRTSEVSKAMRNISMSVEDYVAWRGVLEKNEDGEPVHLVKTADGHWMLPNDAAKVLRFEAESEMPSWRHYQGRGFIDAVAKRLGGKRTQVRVEDERVRGIVLDRKKNIVEQENRFGEFIPEG
jgi:hypothetical protein